MLGSGNLGGEVSLGSVIGLVEAEKARRASVDGSLGIGRPDLSKIQLETPECGDEGKASARVIALTPVVGPANLGARSEQGF